MSLTLPTAAEEGSALLRRPSMAAYMAASTLAGRVPAEEEQEDEVRSTDTAEALREAARKRASLLEEEFPEDAKTQPTPIGVLAIHLLQLKDFDQDAVDINLADPFVRFKAKLSVGDFYRETSQKKGFVRRVREKDGYTSVLQKVAVDELRHFSLKVPQQISDPNNQIKLELFATPNHVKALPFQLIGAVELHLQEIMKAMLIIDVVPLFHTRRRVANLDIEFAFIYGPLGYLHSTQLSNPGFEEEHDMARTMFPRVSLPDDRDGEVLEPVPQHVPRFIPWTCTPVTHWDEAERKAPSGPAPPAPPAAFASKVEEEVRRVLTDYLPISNRKDRLEFLRRLVRGTPEQEQGAGGETEEQYRRPDSSQRPGSSASPQTSGEKGWFSAAGTSQPSRDADRTPAERRTEEKKTAGSPKAAGASGSGGGGGAGRSAPSQDTEGHRRPLQK